MIFGSLFKKLKLVIILIIVIIVLIILVKAWRLKGDIQTMLKGEVNFMDRFFPDESKSKASKSEKNNSGDQSSGDNNSDKDESDSMADRIGSFLFPEQTKRRKAKTAANLDAEINKNGEKEDSELSNEKENEVNTDDETERNKANSERRKANRSKPRRSGSKTSKFKREEICRQVLEEYFDDYFPTCRPKFLLNPRTGHPLELDAYNAALNLAMEYQGAQHRVFPNYFHKTREEFEYQQYKDQFKRDRLKELNINLIEISDQISTKQLKPHIIWLLKGLGY